MSRGECHRVWSHRPRRVPCAVSVPRRAREAPRDVLGRLSASQSRLRGQSPRENYRIALQRAVDAIGLRKRDIKSMDVFIVLVQYI